MPPEGVTVDVGTGDASASDAVAIAEAIEGARQEGRADGQTEGFQIARLMELETQNAEISRRVETIEGDGIWTRERLTAQAETLESLTVQVTNLTALLTPPTLPEATEPEATEPEATEMGILEVTTPPPPERKTRRAFGGLFASGNRHR